MALLLLLAKLQSRLRYSVVVAHLNHNLRGAESERDASLVAKISQKLGVVLAVETLSSPPENPSEDWLRQERYAFFKRVFDKTQASALFFAHHADDQLETRLMRLLQGTGPEGLKGMEEASEQRGMWLIRPFLKVTRAELEAYVADFGIPFHEDKTNRDPRYFRNWVRHGVLEALRQKDPALIWNLRLSLERIAAYVNVPTDQLLKPTRVETKVLDRRKLLGLPEADQQMQAKVFLARYCAARLTSRHVSEFLKRLKTARKHFIFRVAGTDWEVFGDLVRLPSKVEIKS